MRRGRLLVSGAVLASAVAIIAGVTAGGGSSCVFPTCFPDATNTGVPAGTSLTAYTGPTTISTTGTVIDSKNITSCLVVNAGITVTIKNSKISCNPGLGIAVYHPDDAVDGGILTVQDTEIDCQGSNGTAISEADLVLQRVNMHDCENECDLNRNILIEDSYLHDQSSIGSDPHEDGCQGAHGYFDNGNTSTVVGAAARITIRHNTILGENNTGDPGTLSTSAMIWNGGNASPGADADILIEKNLLAGGAVSLYCDVDSVTATNFRVLNNHFSTRYRSTVGEFAPSEACANETEVSGNVYHETGLPITLP